MNTHDCNTEPTRALQPPRLPDPYDTIAEVAEAGAVQAGILAGTDLSRQLSAYEFEVAMYDLERKFRLIESEMRRLIELEIHEALTTVGGVL